MSKIGLSIALYLQSVTWPLDLGQVNTGEPGQLQEDQDHGDDEDAPDAEALERLIDERGALQQEGHGAADHQDH